MLLSEATGVSDPGYNDRATFQCQRSKPFSTPCADRNEPGHDSSVSRRRGIIFPPR